MISLQDADILRKATTNDRHDLLDNNTSNLSIDCQSSPGNNEDEWEDFGDDGDENGLNLPGNKLTTLSERQIDLADDTDPDECDRAVEANRGRPARSRIVDYTKVYFDIRNGRADRGYPASDAESIDSPSERNPMSTTMYTKYIARAIKSYIMQNHMIEIKTLAIPDQGHNDIVFSSMGKPRLIILIRHAQSEGNKNRDIHQTVPDHKVKLTPEGWKQAEEAGIKLRSLLKPDDTLHFYTSPYRRTRETTEGILAALTSDQPSPSPFPRHTIKVYEEPRLREQDFGNYQPCSAEMSRMWQERADYGHFFYRIPNGESAADAYDRVSGFNESLWRSFGEDDFASVCVLVTHGLMTRVFLMKWYHFSVEYFEDLRNINHCEFIVMSKNPDNGKYILRNQLRTWSELKRERAASGITEATSIPIRKKWGGCPDGCDHGKESANQRPPINPAKRQNTADLFKDDGTPAMQQFEQALTRNRSKAQLTYDQDVKDDAAQQQDKSRTQQVEGGGTIPTHTYQNGTVVPISSTSPTRPSTAARSITQIRINDLRTGRDGGGSESGAGSSSENEDNDIDSGKPSPELQHRSLPSQPRSMALALGGALKGVLGGTGLPGFQEGHEERRADALGDQSDMEEEEAGEEGKRMSKERQMQRESGLRGLRDLEGEEREDRSFEGSVR
ncbi:MAG: hypothetical protein MMC33_000592 [Icmadophila ericetorum]|nr:hypothetical protein [Icmadophila ericetorum]